MPRYRLVRHGKANPDRDDTFRVAIHMPDVAFMTHDLMSNKKERRRVFPAEIGINVKLLDCFHIFVA